MKLLPLTTDFTNMDCHVHSRFSPDANSVGADEPQKIADAVRQKGLRGFIITDHLDIGHWDGYIPDFDKYFRTWQRVRDDNPDLTVYIGIEAGFEKHTVKQTNAILTEYPFEYIINSVHYWAPLDHNRHSPRPVVYAEYLTAVRASLDAPYAFSAVGHLGFPERYAKPNTPDREMFYGKYAELFDSIIDAAISRGALFEQNTNCGGEMYLPRKEFLRAYRDKGGQKTVLGSDAHVSADIGRHFDVAAKLSDDVFGKK